MSTSVHRRIVDLPTRPGQIAVVRTDRPGKPHDHKKREIRKECRTAMSRKTDTKVSTTLAISKRFAKAQPLATRTEGRSGETMLAQFRATSPIAARAQTPQEYARQ